MENKWQKARQEFVEQVNSTETKVPDSEFKTAPEPEAPHTKKHKKVVRKDA